MPNQSLSGKWLKVLQEDCRNHGQCISVDCVKECRRFHAVITALKSCLAEEINGMKKEPENHIKNCICVLCSTNNRYNTALDDVLRRIEND